MTVKELLDTLNQNNLVTVTTCGRHGGCLVMDTPAYMAYGYVGEHLNSPVEKISVCRNTLEIKI